MRYRLLEHAYDGELVSEEGPGSLTDLVQTKSTSTVASGELDSREEIEKLDESQFSHLLHESPNNELETQYSYELQAEVDGEWKLVKFLSASAVTC